MVKYTLNFGAQAMTLQKKQNGIGLVSRWPWYQHGDIKTCCHSEGDLYLKKNIYTYLIKEESRGNDRKQDVRETERERRICSKGPQVRLKQWLHALPTQLMGCPVKLTFDLLWVKCQDFIFFQMKHLCNILPWFAYVFLSYAEKCFTMIISFY